MELYFWSSKYLSRLPIMVKPVEDKGKLIQSVGDVTIARAVEVKDGVNFLGFKLLHYSTCQYAKTRDLKITIPRNEFLALCGYDNDTYSRVRNNKKRLEQSLYALSRNAISHEGKTIYFIGTDYKVTKHGITLTLEEDFISLIIKDSNAKNGKANTRYDIRLLKCQSLTAYKLGMELVSVTFNESRKRAGNNGKLKVNKMLAVTEHKLSKDKGYKCSQRKPLENTLDSLSEVFEWHYKTESNTYEEWLDTCVIFTYKGV